MCCLPALVLLSLSTTHLSLSGITICKVNLAAGVHLASQVLLPAAAKRLEVI